MAKSLIINCSSHNEITLLLPTNQHPNSTRNTCVQQPLAISNQANNFLSLLELSLYYEMTIRYKNNHKSGENIFRFLLH